MTKRVSQTEPGFVALSLCHTLTWDIKMTSCRTETEIVSRMEKAGPAVVSQWCRHLSACVRLTVDILSTLFCGVFMVQCLELMLSKFLHLQFLLCGCFACCQNVTCLKRIWQVWHCAGDAEDIFIVRFAIVS